MHNSLPTPSSHSLSLSHSFLLFLSFYTLYLFPITHSLFVAFFLWFMFTLSLLLFSFDTFFFSKYLFSNSVFEGDGKQLNQFSGLGFSVYNLGSFRYYHFFPLGLLFNNNSSNSSSNSASPRLQSRSVSKSKIFAVRPDVGIKSPISLKVAKIIRQSN